MNLFIYLLLVSFMYKTTSSHEFDLVMKLKNEMTNLEEMINLSIKSGILQLEQQLKEIEEKSLELKNDADDLIREHTVAIVENIQDVAEAFIASGRNISICADGLNDAISMIQEKGIRKTKGFVKANNLKSRNTVVKAIPLLNDIRNKTTEMQKMIQNCLEFEEGDECLLQITEKIEILKQLMPTVIERLIERHDLQLKIFESEILSDVQKILNSVVGSHTDIFDTFIQCVL